jgi:cytochrome c oxidase subunit 2
VLALLLVPTAAAWANPEPWETGLQSPGSAIMERVTSFHDLLLWIISVIVLFVFVLLAYAC